MKYTELQPKDGDVVLHCGHLDDKPHHFYVLGGASREPIHFHRPDGSVGEATWMVLCHRCFQVYPENPEKCMRADATWIGNEPEIKDDSN
jgi:hypothetical protein